MRCKNDGTQQAGTQGGRAGGDDDKETHLRKGTGKVWYEREENEVIF